MIAWRAGRVWASSIRIRAGACRDRLVQVFVIPLLALLCCRVELADVTIEAWTRVEKDPVDVTIGGARTIGIVPEVDVQGSAVFTSLARVWVHAGRVVAMQDTSVTGIGTSTFRYAGVEIPLCGSGRHVSEDELPVLVQTFERLGRRTGAAGSGPGSGP